MTRPSRHAARLGRSAALVAASALTFVALAGCATDTPDTPAATPDPASETKLVLIPMPHLDPVPEPAPPLTEDESEAARLADADAQWEALLVTHPDAVRPADPFDTYITEDERVEVRRACYDTAGLQVEEGRAATDPMDPS